MERESAFPSPAARLSVSERRRADPSSHQTIPSLSLSLSFFHPRNARPLPHTRSPAQPPCPSFPRQSSRKEGAGPAAAQPPPPRRRRVQVDIAVMQRGARRGCILACSAPFPSLPHPYARALLHGGRGRAGVVLGIWKIRSRLRCTWAPRASYVGVVYNRSISMHWIEKTAGTKRFFVCWKWVGASFLWVTLSVCNCACLQPQA